MSPPEPPRFAPGAGRPRPAYTPRKVACPNCGAGLEIKDEHGRLAVCATCKSHLEVSKAEAKVLSQESKKAQQAEGVFDLEIGDSFRDKKTRFEVIGRLRYDEAGEPDPTRQYLLYNPRRGTLWLSEYRGHWDLSRTSRVVPQGDARTLSKGDTLSTHDGRHWLLAGKGTYRLGYVDGALPWVTRVGDRIDYAELVAADGSGETYEVEFPRSSKEMEFGRGRLLTVKEVRRATGKDLPSPRGSRENVPEIVRGLGTLKKIAAITLLINVLAMFFFMASGREVLDQSLTDVRSEVMTQPFSVAHDGDVVRIDLEAPLDNSWMAIDLGLVRDEGAESKVIHVTDEDLEFYHGSEGGESWTEGSRSTSQYLRIDTAGDYRLLVRADSGTGETPSTTGSGPPLRVRVMAGAKQLVWTVLASVASLAVLIFAVVRHQKWRSADDEEDD